MRTDAQRDMTNLIVDFRYFSKGLKSVSFKVKLAPLYDTLFSIIYN